MSTHSGNNSISKTMHESRATATKSMKSTPKIKVLKNTHASQMVAGGKFKSGYTFTLGCPSG